MNIKTFSFVLLFMLTFSSLVFSQDEREKLRIHIAPLNLLDPITGVLQVGVQKNLSDRFSISLDHGFQMQTFKYLNFDKGVERENLKYSKTKAELKYFLNENRGSAFPQVVKYLSLEGVYFPQEYTKENEFLYRDRVSYQYSLSDIDRQALVASLKYGKEILYKKFTIDYFFGLGVRWLSIRHSPYDLVEKEYYGPADWDFHPVDRNEGNSYRAHASLGIKLGYSLK